MSGCSRPDKNKAGGKKKAKSATKKCPVEQLLDQIRKCDGGTNILAKAKKANKNKDVKVVIKPLKFGGETDHDKGQIGIRKGDPPCTQIETLLFEMANMSSKERFDKSDNEALKGNTNRKDYIREQEKIEYDNVKDTLKAIDACKEKWGCKRHTFDFDGYRSAKNFDDYYKNYLPARHKNHYGDFWDKNCKAAYEKKHPKKTK